jgi:hypothetical protein
MKRHLEVEVQIRVFSDSVSFTPLPFYSSAYFVGGRVGPRFCLELRKREKYLALPGIEPDFLYRSFHSQSLY